MLVSAVRRTPSTQAFRVKAESSWSTTPLERMTAGWRRGKRRFLRRSGCGPAKSVFGAVSNVACVDVMVSDTLFTKGNGAGLSRLLRTGQMGERGGCRFVEV